MKKIIMIMLIILLTLTGCSESKELYENEISAFNEILNRDIAIENLANKTDEMINDSIKKKFPAIKKVYLTDDNKYLFISEPVAYNGPVTLAVAIDGASNETIGIRVVKHSETKHYVRDFENNWFTDRFKNKASDKYLKEVHLDAKNDDEIVIITGATTTTEGVINGVNACIGMYSEAVLNNEMPSVKLKATINKNNDMPKENEKIIIRTNDNILNEVSLDEIKKLQSYRRKIVINSSAGTQTCDFRGALLFDILFGIDKTIVDNYSTAKIIGADGYYSNVTMEEIKKENKVFIMYENSGKPLESLNGKLNSFRLIVLGDDFGQRYTNYVIEIIFE